MYREVVEDAAVLLGDLVPSNGAGGRLTGGVVEGNAVEGHHFM